MPPIVGLRLAREQFGDAAERSGIDGERSLGGEPEHVVRPAGLRPGAGQSSPKGCTPTTAPIMLRLT